MRRSVHKSSPQAQPGRFKRLLRRRISLAPPADADAPPLTPEQAATLTRNFWSWVAYQFFYRIGWQFKMESTMMAGLISYLAPAPALMGCFTTLNTLGRTLSPLAAAPIVDRFRLKNRALLLFFGLAIAAWLALTLYLWTPSARDKSVSIWVFAVCYTLFFIFLGAANVAQGALLGKVIPAGIRGRAMAVGTALSGVFNVGAILFIYAVVLGGGFPEPLNYALAFSLTVGFFLLSAASLLRVREEASETAPRGFNLRDNLRYFVELARSNRNLSRLMAVNAAVSVGGSMLQFYTGYWRQAGTMTESALILATVLQVVWQSGSSGVFGRMADLRGNRRVICLLLWVEAVIPLVAWALGGWEPFRSSWVWYLGVYTLVGLRFPMYQLLVNYLLEIVPQEDHAMAIGAVTTVQLLTAPAPLILGIVAGGAGYPIAFAIASAFGLYAAITARHMDEVRIPKPTH